MRNALLLAAIAGFLSLGCSGKGENCTACKPSCANGLVTLCLPLLPPGCGGQSATQFCPYGCSGDGAGMCNLAPADGVAPSGCTASSATIAKGSLTPEGAAHTVAVTTFLATETRVVLATSADIACAATSSTGARS
jgi:hypothetical protein